MPFHHALRVALAVCAIAVGTDLAAQSEPRILGLTNQNPILQSQDLQTCRARRCAPAGFPAAVNRLAGGTAYDTRTRGTWITNGQRIAKVDSRNQCAYQCSVQTLAMPIAAGPNAVATGLAYEHGRNVLWVTDSQNGISQYRVDNCNLRFASRCSPPLPAGFTLTGIAFDDIRDQVIYTSADLSGVVPAAGGAVAIAPAAAPCQPTCVARARVCPSGTVLGPLRGVGYDACRELLWITDGQTSAAGRIDPAACTFNITRCCPNPSAAVGENYVGLCIEPSTEASVGSPCSSAGCASCAPRLFFGSGDPVLGNTDFTLDGRNLPANTIAATLFNVGACSPTGITIPPICGPIHVALSPTLLGFNQGTGGTVGCTGRTSLNASVHPDPNLCGVVLSSQIIGLCVVPGSPIVGTYTSNCLSWRVSGS